MRPFSTAPTGDPMTDDTRDARRRFLKGAGLAVAGGLLPGLAGSAEATRSGPAQGAPADAPASSEQAKLDRLASNTYPMRALFKRRNERSDGRGAQAADAMKQKYGEITLLDFPQFTRDRFPGVRRMDLWSSLFGDVTDASMFIETKVTRGERTRSVFEFDPVSAAGRKWLDQLAARMAKTGVTCHHVSNNAPRDISELDESARRQGIDTAKKWLDACAVLRAKTMRVNTGGPRIAPSATATTGYPRNDEIVKYFTNAIESFKEMADHGGKVGVKVTIENHWGLSADPMNIRIILDEVNHPFCEASPDFCNWEHEYMLYHGLKALAPYAH
ncbi:MAG: sugar phosphate isomerase/epimerase family protein, partial [Vicinamibacteraceae bacterium]